MHITTNICQQAILHSEGHMDDGLTLSRCQREESHTARLILSASLLFTQFVRYIFIRGVTCKYDLASCL